MLKKKADPVIVGTDWKFDLTRITDRDLADYARDSSIGNLMRIIGRCVVDSKVAVNWRKPYGWTTLLPEDLAGLVTEFTAIISMLAAASEVSEPGFSVGSSEGKR